jgi:GTP-binding protein HflX
VRPDDDTAAPRNDDTASEEWHPDDAYFAKRYDGIDLEPPDAAGDIAAGSEGELTRAEERRRRRDVIEEGAPREGVDIIRRVERAVIVGVHLPGRTLAELEASLDELEALLDTAGAEVAERIVQRRDAPDAATYIGRGKVAELRDIAAEVGADAVVFDDELAPAQQRTLEEGIRQKVLDRTIVILDIFAQHATSREGKAQVELAQLGYLLPRLRGWGEALSRQAGGRVAGGAGIGGRGPGETQLEVDRRRIMRRIRKLKSDLTDFERIRRTKALERERNRVPTAAIVGYTNAGKSSLLNRLTGANVLAEDRLFATLDATVRRLDTGDGRDVVLTDTVGFVRKLPTSLVEAFKSTLEESTRADLLLHVVDASHPEAEAQIVAVREVLEEIGADRRPEQIVLNKIDRADLDELAALARRVENETGTSPVLVSAVTGAGIDELVGRIQQRLPGQRLKVRATIPFARHDLVAAAHERGEVHLEEHSAEGTTLVASVDAEVAQEMRPWLEDDPFARQPEPWELETDED